MIGKLAVFVVTALLEIAGCFAFWAWLRRGASPLVAVAGVVSLIGFAVYIVASLVWWGLAEGQRPTATDLIGGALAIGGALVIVSLSRRVP